MFFETVYAISTDPALAGTDTSIFSGTMDFGDFVLLAISIFVLFSSILSIVFILWGGLLLILSGGKDDKIKPAINTIRYAVIGIVITVLTIFLFPIFGRLLGLNVEQYAQPKRIFEKISEIGTKVFGASSQNYHSPNINIEGNIDDIPVDFESDL